MNLQWFPGHMAKTRRLMAEHLKIIDLAAELVDARLPLSSRNPEIDKILGKKPRLIILNKSDMADPDANAQWAAYFQKQGIAALEVSSSTGKGISKISDIAKTVLSEKIENDQARGIHRNLKIMVCGIPNVGKSSFINKIAGRAGTKTGDRPGVTKGKQWVRLDNGIELLDMPGILWPKFDSDDVAVKLAFTGAIRDEILDVEHLCCILLEFLRSNYPESLCRRYQLTEVAQYNGYELLELICKRRGFLVSGGEFDTFRGANMVLNEFRGCRLGNITLERPGQPPIVCKNEMGVLTYAG